MAELLTAKQAPQLEFSDRIDMIKNKPAFSLAFPLGILALIIVLFGVVTSGEFFKTSVLLGIFNQALIVGTMATAVSFIYATGNIDISVGSVMALSAIIGALAYQITQSMALMLIVTAVSGVVLMLFNYVMGITFGIPSILVAIVVMQLYTAIIQAILGPDVLRVDYAVCKVLETGGFRNVVFIGYFVFSIIVFHFTPIGRKLRLIGGNAKCALQTGIKPDKTIFYSFLMAGVGVGVAAMFTVIRTGSINQATGANMGMDVMLATVLGGMSIFGGSKSNSYSGLIGALTVVALDKGLLMIGVSSMAIQGIRGFIFLILVFLNSVRPSTLPSKQQM